MEFLGELSEDGAVVDEIWQGGYYWFWFQVDEPSHVFWFVLTESGNAFQRRILLDVDGGGFEKFVWN